MFFFSYLNLNDSDIRVYVDSAINSAFDYGRMRISGLITSTVSSNESNATLVSQQVDQFLVHLHEAWIGVVKLILVLAKCNKDLKTFSSFTQLGYLSCKLFIRNAF